MALSCASAASAVARSPSFAALTPTPLYPFLRHPSFGSIYFTKLRQLLVGPLSVASVNALLDQILTGVVAPARIAERRSLVQT